MLARLLPTFAMDDEMQEQVFPGGHYSGTNRVPNIKQFIERLDRDKKHRDAQIDAENTNDQGKTNGKAAEAERAKSGKRRRTVRDPVTGRDVEIDDIDSSFMKASKNPQVGRPARKLLWSSRG